MENKEMILNMKPTLKTAFETSSQFHSSIISGVDLSEECRSDFQFMATAAYNLILHIKDGGFDPGFIITRKEPLKS